MPAESRAEARTVPGDARQIFLDHAMEDPAPDSKQLHWAHSRAAAPGQARLLREQTVGASSPSQYLPSHHVMVNIIDLTGSRITMETDL